MTSFDKDVIYPIRVFMSCVILTSMFYTLSSTETGTSEEKHYTKEIQLKY